MPNKLNISIIGCGYIADFYLQSLCSSRNIFNLVSLYDINTDRSALLSRIYGIPVASSIQDILEDKDIHLVINLTGPSSHYEIIVNSLENNKHVFTEKPITLTFEELFHVHNLAKSKKLALWSAPAIPFTPYMKYILNNQLIKYDLTHYILSRFETSPLHKYNPYKWKSPNGIEWPINDELRQGSVIEHSGYLFSFLAFLFGPVKELSSLASIVFEKETRSAFQLPEKFPLGVNHSIGSAYMADGSHCDLIVSECSNMVRRFEIFSEQYKLCIPDLRDDYCPMLFTEDSSWIARQLSRRSNYIYQVFRQLANILPELFAINLANYAPYSYSRLLRISKSYKLQAFRRRKPVDFARPIISLQKIINESEFESINTVNDFCCHITELTIAFADLKEGSYKPKTIYSLTNLQRVIKNTY